MNNAKTPCMKTCLLSFIAVYVFIMAYTFLVHGVLLKADYEAYASLWRPMEEMMSLGYICWLAHAVMAAVLTCLYKKFRAAKMLCTCGPECQCGPACPCKAGSECGTTRCPIKSGGLCFGFKIGLLLGVYHASFYILLPISGALAIKWFLAEFVMGLGVGAVLGMVYHPGAGKGCSKTSCDTKVM